MKRLNAEKLVTIIIPSKIVDTNLRFCIKKILKYYKNIKIILLLDRDSKIKFSKNIKIIVTGNKAIGYKRNLGAKLSKTKYISFIDSDAYPNNRWLDFILLSFKKNKNTVAVGGPNISPSTSNIEKKLVSKVRKLFFVTFDNKVKYKTKFEFSTKYLPSVNLVIKKNIYLRLGGMNENINTGEDTVFMNNINNQNYKMIQNGMAYVFHKDRNFRNFFRQRLVYGSNLVKNFFLSPSLITLMMCMSILPSVYCLMFPIVLFMNYFYLKIYFYGFFFLLLVCIYFSFKIYEKGSFFKSFILILMSIFGPGLGFILSLIRSEKSLRKIYTQV